MSFATMPAREARRARQAFTASLMTGAVDLSSRFGHVVAFSLRTLAQGGGHGVWPSCIADTHRSPPVAGQGLCPSFRVLAHRSRPSSWDTFCANSSGERPLVSIARRHASLRRSCVSTQLFTSERRSCQGNAALPRTVHSPEVPARYPYRPKRRL